MSTMLETFESIVRDGEGDSYKIVLHGKSRPHDTWQGWLEFIRERDGQKFETAVETTQPNAEAVRYWATGLSDTFLDGALRRALRPPAPQVASAPAPLPVTGGRIDAVEHERRRTLLEQEILDIARAASGAKILVRDLMAALPHSSADVTRALEHLEKEDRYLIRATEQGSVWVILTDDGVSAARLHS
jgi:hypothetical protein